MYINKKIALLFVGALLLVSAVIFLGLRWGVVFFDVASPLAHPWMEIRMSDGSVFYGKLDGIALGVVRLSRVHFLDRYTPAAGSDAPETLGSSNYMVGGKIVPTSERYVVDQRPGFLYLNRSAIVLWGPVDPAAPVAKYLQ